MLSMAFASLIFAVAFGVIGLSGVAGAATHLAGLLSMIAVIGSLVLFIACHRPRVF